MANTFILTSGSGSDAKNKGSANMIDWKKVPRGTLSISNIAMAVVIVKIALSEPSYDLAALAAAISAIFIAKVVVEAPRLDLELKIEDLTKEMADLHYQLVLLREAHKEVIKQSEETKSLLSKANITTAFAARSRL